MNFTFKKNFIFFILLTFSVLSVQASGKRDKLFETVETGTEKEIKSALKKNPDYANIKRGKEKESLLMSALKEDRGLSVINILLKYGADPMQKDAEKRNSIMYAAKYSSSPGRITSETFTLSNLLLYVFCKLNNILCILQVSSKFLEQKRSSSKQRLIAIVSSTHDIISIKEMFSGCFASI